MMEESIRLNKWIFLFLLGYSFKSFSQVNIPDVNRPLPLIEGGAGVFHARFPHYPSAATNFSLTLPYPTFIYRGDVLRADENGGVRSRFFKTENFEINLSVGGALPVSSEKITVRDGMPDLKTMVEFGPGLIWHVIPRKNKPRFQLNLNLPIRIAITSDLKDTDDRGYVINPFLFGFGRLVGSTNIFYFLSYRWANSEFQKTFFEVEPKYATATRPSFIANSGSVVASAGLGFSHLFFSKYQLFTGASYDNYSINPNRESPLFQRNTSITYVFGLTWWFYKSQKTVSVNQ